MVVRSTSPVLLLAVLAVLDAAGSVVFVEAEAYDGGRDVGGLPEQTLDAIADDPHLASPFIVASEGDAESANGGLQDEDGGHHRMVDALVAKGGARSGVARILGAAG